MFDFNACSMMRACMQAARDGMLDAVRSNLDDSRTQMNDVDDDGFTALHYAARYNRLGVVEVLVKAGAGLSRSAVSISVFNKN